MAENLCLLLAYFILHFFEAIIYLLIFSLFVIFPGTSLEIIGVTIVCKKKF